MIIRITTEKEMYYSLEKNGKDYAYSPEKFAANYIAEHHFFFSSDDIEQHRSSIKENAEFVIMELEIPDELFDSILESANLEKKDIGSYCHAILAEHIGYENDNEVDESEEDLWDSVMADFFPNADPEEISDFLDDLGD